MIDFSAIKQWLRTEGFESIARFNSPVRSLECYLFFLRNQPQYLFTRLFSNFGML
jgi:hypothetical protein